LGVVARGKGSSPLGDTLDKRAREAARRAGQPGGATIPSGACGWGWAHADDGVVGEKVRRVA
jgi:hypothetical protein